MSGALREQFDAGTADMEGGSQPPECAGASDQQIEDLFTEIVGDEFDTPPAEPEPEVTEEPASEIAKVGPDEWFEYTDGIEVQVTKLEAFELGPDAFSGAAGELGVVVTVTLKNGTGAVFDASMADVQVTYGPNGDPTEREYDEEGFTGSIPPGKNGTAKFDFGTVPAKYLKDILVQVAPSFDHQPSFFEGAAK